MKTAFYQEELDSESSLEKKPPSEEATPPKYIELSSLPALLPEPQSSEIATEKEKTQMQLVVILVSERSLPLVLVIDFGLIAFTRLFSGGSYFLSLQAFMRDNPTNMDLVIDYSFISMVLGILFMFLQAIINETKMAENKRQFEGAEQADKELQKIFLAGQMASICLTFLVWAIGQGYVLLLPYMGRRKEVSRLLSLLPTQNLPNFFFNIAVIAHANFAYALNQAGPLAIIYTVGGMIMISAYLALKEVSQSFEFFFLANILQAVSIYFFYMMYLALYHKEKKWMSGLWHLSEWSEGMKHGRKIIWDSIQPASIVMWETISYGLMNILIKIPMERRAFQALKIIPSLITSMITTMEGRTSVQVLEINKKFQHDPENLKKSLMQLWFHASWIGNVIPVVFFMLALLIKNEIIPLLIKPTKENVFITEIAGRDLMLACLPMIFRMFRSSAYGVILGYKKSDAEHQHRNFLAAMINNISAVLALVMGLILDYVFDKGAQGYWFSIIAFMMLSAVFQSWNAKRTIDHAVELACGETISESSAERIVSETSTQGFFSKLLFWKNPEKKSSSITAEEDISDEEALNDVTLKR
jgi:hypothetical protein